MFNIPLPTFLFRYSYNIFRYPFKGFNRRNQLKEKKKNDANSSSVTYFINLITLFNIIKVIGELTLLNTAAVFQL